MEKQKTTINGILDLAGISDYDKQQISDRAEKILAEYSRDLLTDFAKYTYNRIKTNTGEKYSVFNIENFALDYFNDIFHQAFYERLMTFIDDKEVKRIIVSYIIYERFRHISDKIDATSLLSDNEIRIEYLKHGI